MPEENLTQYDEELEDEQETSADEELEILDFDLETLTLEGKDAVIERTIEFYDIRDNKKKKMRINVRPLTKKEKTEIERRLGKKNSKLNLEELLCEKGLLDKDGMRYDINQIRKLPSGVVANIAQEIRYISGEFTDRFEDKAITELFGGS